ncbi:unnamed protein product [Allacma fusca]|uniref:Uncharacterized protein n=1 Tax=Allacma fusca TaxID=39272 RepID=A0A8J2KLA4_9HEXA|nr:unnamed protein product [Allacma fusca]
MDEEARRRNSKLFLLGVSSVLILLLVYPWIFGVSCLFFLAGHFLFESILEKVEVSWLKSKDGTESPQEVYQLDPLLHPTPYLSPEDEEQKRESVKKKEIDPVTCSVCDTENCPRAATSNNDPRPDCRVTYGSKCHDLRVDPSLDKALARFCTTVFDFYINSSWAPYETRKQLRLSLKKLLTNFGEKLEITLAEDERVIAFTQDKIIPLCIHYIDKLANKRNIKLTEKVRLSHRKELERISSLKTRRLCRQLFQYNMPPEDQNCGIWMELCMAVLADGVLWNLFILGRDRLPGVFLDLSRNYKRTLANASWPARKEFFAFINMKLTNIASFTWDYVHSKMNNKSGVDTISNENQNNFEAISDVQEASQCKVPLLLDSFVDPSNDIYQPDFIKSRWRPRLEEILNERELLYCLIQYLKGNRALEYLQAVLDESPDGNEYCKKVLQLEYLPSFCRSKFFMESLGVSQVDCALEAGSDSPGSRRKSGHSRSSSSGGGNSGMQIWKIGDPKAVDGLPLHSNQVGASTVQYPESDAAVRRRQYSIEMIITKFVESTLHSSTAASTAVGKPAPTRRDGIDAKNYLEHAIDEINSRVIVGSCDIYDCITETGISLINNHIWVRPVLTGWLQHLRPCIKPFFDRSLQHQLRQHLSIGTCVYLIDLVTDAFLTGIVSTSEVPSQPEPVNLQIQDSDPTETRQNEENERIAKIQQSLITLSCRFLSEFIDPVTLTEMIQDNEDEIILFFVDLLDLLVNHVCGTPAEA